MAESTDKAASPQEEAKKEKKSKKVWTLEKCLKVAKRFPTKDEWVRGAPSSYKSALSHQWIEKCIAHMKEPVKQEKAKGKTLRKSA